MERLANQPQQRAHVVLGSSGTPRDRFRLMRRAGAICDIGKGRECYDVHNTLLQSVHASENKPNGRSDDGSKPPPFPDDKCSASQILVVTIFTPPRFCKL